MISPHRRICALVIFGLCILCLNASAQTPGSQRADTRETTGPVVEMEPYIVKGERILPDPESWLYIKVPALVLDRNGREVVVPGYEVLSSRIKKNTLVFVNELQLRQLAGAILFPYLVEALPRSPIVLVLDDDNKLRQPAASPVIKAWRGDSAFTARALRAADERPDTSYSVGTQMSIYSDNVFQMPSRYNEDTDRMEAAPEEDLELPAGQTATTTQLPRQNFLAQTAANGGPLTIYLYGSRNSGPHPEEWLAREAWVGLNGYALHRLANRVPPWLHAGLAELFGMVTVSYRFIDFGHPPASISHRRAGFDHFASLAEVLQAKDRGALTRIPGGKRTATKFVHYCLYADNGKYAGRFFKFIERLESEPFTAPLFKECLGQKLSSMEAAMATQYSVFTWYKYTRYKGALPDMPNVLVREATQSEIARIKGEMFTARNWTPLALDELRIAYWRGEREPNMLALLAFLEEHIGSISRAEKITKSLLALPNPPARAYAVAAKLRLREFDAGEKDSQKLGKSETDSVMACIIKARELGMLNEDLCTTLARLILHSEEAPGEEIATFISAAAKQYPLNKTIAAACTPDSSG